MKLKPFCRHYCTHLIFCSSEAIKRERETGKRTSSFSGFIFGKTSIEIPLTETHHEEKRTSSSTTKRLCPRIESKETASSCATE